ncbi:hypothetical protein [Edwardsiella tarda]|uniref:hypothetical protein n=1 Tax=Edwardsiella tarda TaxID=636 RepID=UPI003F65F6A6
MSDNILIPEEGLYVSKNNQSLRFVVTDVDMVDDEEDEEGDSFFLVTVVREGDEDDMSAPGYEYDPDEWQQFVRMYQLEFVPGDSMSLSELRELLSKTKNK